MKIRSFYVAYMTTFSIGQSLRNIPLNDYIMSFISVCLIGYLPEGKKLPANLWHSDIIYYLVSDSFFVSKVSIGKWKGYVYSFS